MSTNLPSATGPNVVAGLAYLFGFISGSVALLVAGNDELVRFSAVQSIILSAAYVIVRIVLSIIFGILLRIPVVNVVASLIIGPLRLVVGLAFLVAWLVAMLQAFQGKAVRLPLIGVPAARYARVS
jgi:uncharacterized membrane protein